MNPLQTIFLKERIIALENEVKNLADYLFNGEMQKEIEAIDKRWEQELGKYKTPLKLIILAEAPLSFERYFYNKQFTFLDSLRSFWKLKLNADLPARMIKEGILLLDLYPFPIPSNFYKKDTNNILFDDNYLSKKLALLKKEGLIDDQTHLTFRYKALVKTKKLHQTNALKGLNILKDKIGDPIWINRSEKPQKLNVEVEQYLNPT